MGPITSGEELREISRKLQLAKLRDRFALHQRMALRAADMTQALLTVQPKIVHFSGHGTTAGDLCIEDEQGKTYPIPPDALAALFEQFTSCVDCVVLNACYTDLQANAIAQHIHYVIGMSKAISDKAAIAFAIGFYQALGADRTIEEAYRIGRVQIKLHGVPENLTPVLISKTAQVTGEGKQASDIAFLPQVPPRYALGQKDRELSRLLRLYKSDLIQQLQQGLIRQSSGILMAKKQVDMRLGLFNRNVNSL